MTDKLAFAAALTALLAVGCGRISDPEPAAPAQSAAPPSFYEFSSARMDPSAQDGTVFDYH